jgi:GGDEF domain-containing protein
VCSPEAITIAGRGLAAASLATAPSLALSELLTGAVLLVTGGALGAALFGFTRRRDPVASQPLDNLSAGATATLPPPPPSAETEVGRRMTTAYLAWLAGNDEQADLWSSFDQLIREMLTEHVGATRVRCYHVQPGEAALQPISGTSAETPSAREGVLGYVATTGREYVAGDDSHGPLVDDLAAQGGEDWAWVWPITEHGVTVGVVATGRLPAERPLSDERRQAVGAFLTLMWQHIASHERLRVVQRTDKATGVLTRNDFFTLAGHALADSYRENEPVVMMVLVLEGLRGLDDAGCWQARDTLIRQLGELIARRTRSDDLVGRFADDRFVVLLRRLDSGLGRLIAEKTLASARTCLAQLEGVAGRVQFRIGLVGSGFTRLPLDGLLVAAFGAVDQARKGGAAIWTDLEEKRATPERGPRPTGST